MSSDTIFALGMAVYAATTVAIIVLLWRSRHDGLPELSERAVEASLAPRTGVVGVSSQNAPFDREMDLEHERAVDYLMALHKIDSALEDYDPWDREMWDRALGEGRN